MTTLGQNLNRDNMDLTVRQIPSKDAYPFIMDIHYAKRKPSISYAYGLFEDDNLIGICTYGQPASPMLCQGILGKENKHMVIELNRLCLLYNRKNEASFLVGRSLKLLPRPKVIVSYSDSAQNHVGTVYQACNFIFTGTTKPRTDMAAEDGKHSRHHKGDPANRVNRSAKHRYIYFVGSKSDIRYMLSNLKYPTLTQYPKNYKDDSNANL
jgi:hypothetical protein